MEAYEAHEIAERIHHHVHRPTLLERLHSSLRPKLIRARWKRTLRQYMRAELAAWKMLDCLSPQDKAKIKSEVFEYIKVVILQGLIAQRVMFVVDRIAAPLIAITLLYILVIKGDIIGEGDHFIEIIFSVLAVLLMSAIYWGTQKIISRKFIWPYRSPISWLNKFPLIASLLFCVTVIVISSLSRANSHLGQAIYFAGLVSCAAWVLFLAYVFLRYGLIRVLIRLNIKRFPFQYVSAFLFRAIFMLEKSKLLGLPTSSWADPGTRSRIMADLDEAARIIRRHLFRELKTTDRAAWFWREDRARLIANALCDKQRWLMTPMSETRTKLLEKLAAMYMSILTGEWDRLEISEGVNITRAQTFRSGVQIARSALTGLIPIGIFLLARRWEMIAIAPPVADYVTGGLLLWAALSVVMAIDPTLTEKTSAMKDLLSIIPGLGKKGEKG